MPFDNAPITGSFNRGGFIATVDQLDRGKSELGMGYVLAASGVAVPLTGTVAETTLAAIPIPGSLLGPNGLLRISAAWSATNSANNKTLRTKIGGATFWTQSTANWIKGGHMASFINRGVEDAQQPMCADYTSGVGFGGGGGFLQTAVDTRIDQMLTITGQLSSAGESLTLEAYLVEVFPSP